MVQTGVVSPKDGVSVVIPALNEENTVGSVVRAALQCRQAHQVIVVDNNSSDRTAKVAASTGAEVVFCEERGLGSAMKAGIRASHLPWILKFDADMRNVSPEWVSEMIAGYDEGVNLVKAWWHSDVDPMPVTKLLARPSLRCFFPELTEIIMPLSGIYLFAPATLVIDAAPNNWAFDISVLIDSWAGPNSISQVKLPKVEDNYKTVDTYPEMSFEILEYLRGKSESKPRHNYCFVVKSIKSSFASCGGTILRLASQGHNVSIISTLSNDSTDRERNTIAQTLPSLISISWRSMVQYEDLLPFLEEASLNVLVISEGWSGPIEVSSSRLTFYELLASRPGLSSSLDVYTFRPFQNLAPSDPTGVEKLVDISEFSALKYRLIRDWLPSASEPFYRAMTALDTLNGARAGVQAAEAYNSTPLFFRRPTSFI